jgi:hypothetical protein
MYDILKSSVEVLEEENKMNRGEAVFKDRMAKNFSEL